MATATSAAVSDEIDFDALDEQVYALADELGLQDIQRANHRYINARPKQQLYVFDYGSVQCFVGAEHPQLVEVITKMVELMDECHPELLKYLNLLGFPYDVHDDDGDEPNYLGATGASAWSIDGTVYVWGREHAEHNWYAFSSIILNHELGHLVAQDNQLESHRAGPPDQLRVAWLAAMQRDRLHQMDMPMLDIHRAKQRIHGERLLSRKFGYSTALINHYAEDCRDEDYGLIEDWAESIGFYLTDGNRGCVWHSDDGLQTFRFADYYPHRAAIIKSFLQSLEEDAS